MAAKSVWRRPGCLLVLPGLRTRLVAVDAALREYGSASAVVAVLLRERGGLDVLVMERATRASDPWSGHWSFPGGRRNKEESLLGAVRREAEEEVGLSLAVAPIGCLPARAPANRPELLVLPFVFTWDGTTEPHASSPEVASVAWVPIAELAGTRGTMTVMFREQERAMPAFVSGRRTIWGFTYRLLEDLLALVQ